MCGIVAILRATQGEVFSLLLEGLYQLQNRGYDSAGIALATGNALKIAKFSSTPLQSALGGLEKAKDGFSKSTIGIGHTRWATHGAKTDENAHPHGNSTETLAMVHNGIIDNYKLIKDTKLAGVSFRSSTDTEVFAHLVDHYMAQTSTLYDAFAKAADTIEGTWAIAMVHNDHPNELYLCRHGSPLLFARDHDTVYVASEGAAFGKYVTSWRSIADGECICIRRDVDRGEFLVVNRTGEIPLSAYVPGPVIHNQGVVSRPDPTPYNHWTRLEISEQPEALRAALNYGGRLSNRHVKLGGLDRHRGALVDATNIILLGCGTSYYAAEWGARMFRKVTRFASVRAVDASEFSENDLLSNLFARNTVVVVISQSGETKDCHRAMGLVRARGIPTIGVVNVVSSLLARETTCGIYLNAGREVGVASTKSFTSQCVVLTLLANWFACMHHGGVTEPMGSILDALETIPDVFATLLVAWPTRVQTFAKSLVGKRLFILGKHWAHSVAMEGALKVKELCYIHAEGFAGGSLKHGPLALVDKHAVVVVHLLDNDQASIVRSTIEEVCCRGGRVIVLTNIDTYRADDLVFHIGESNEAMASLCCVLFHQLVAYYLALELGHNPDFPRNLAKVVTVDG